MPIFQLPAGDKTSDSYKAPKPKYAPPQPTPGAGLPWVYGHTGVDMFFQMTRSLTVLPHEIAQFYYAQQSIADGSTWVTPTVDTTDSRTYYKGLSVDSANGKIEFTGIAGEAGFVCYAYVAWAANNTNRREAKINMGASIAMNDIVNACTDATKATTSFPFCFGVSTSTETYFQLQVRQDSGGALNMDFAYFFVARTR